MNPLYCCTYCNSPVDQNECLTYENTSHLTTDRDYYQMKQLQ